MNTNARILSLLIAVSVLNAHALSANNDGKKKATPPPAAARPQQSSAQQAPAAVPHAQSNNRSGIAADVTHPQPGGATAGTGAGVTHPQPGGATAGTAAGVTRPRPGSATAGATAGVTRPQLGGGTAKPSTGVNRSRPGNASAPSGQRTATRAQLQQRMSTRPSQQERTHAHESYRSERAHFARHMEPLRFAPGHRLILTRMRIVPGTYYYRRSAFYDTYGWVTPPYVYAMYPRYGLWDAGFLAFALHHVADEQYAMMIYHHWADPEIQQWVRDTNGAAGQNAELRAQVTAMNDRMSRLERAGIARDPSYVPPDAQDVALSPDAVDQLGAK